MLGALLQNNGVCIANKIYIYPRNVYFIQEGNTHLHVFVFIQDNI